MAGAEEVSHPLHATTPERAETVVATRLDEGIAEWARLAEALTEPELREAVRRAGEALVCSLAAGRTLLVAGNGGSAADAAHVAGEFIGKCVLDRAPLPAVNLAESAASITAIGNDYGFDQVFTRGVAAHGRPGDVFLGMTTSGRSPNLVAALAEARARGLVTIAMVGQGGAHLAGQVDHLLVVPSDYTPRIQEVHLMWAHAWCEAVDELSQPSV